MSIDVDWCRFDCHKNTTGLFKNWRHYVFTTFMLGILNKSIIGFICDMCENHLKTLVFTTWIIIEIYLSYRKVFTEKRHYFFYSISLRFPHPSKKSLDFLFKYYFLKALPVLIAVVGGRLQYRFLHIRVLHHYYLAVFIVSTGSIIECFIVLTSWWFCQRCSGYCWKWEFCCKAAAARLFSAQLLCGRATFLLQFNPLFFL